MVEPGVWPEITSIGESLQSRSLVSAHGAAGALPKHVARRVAAPAVDGDGARQWRVVLAPLAV
jgi:hypothetical protein